jgi:RNA polymerase sigma-70 factor (ECF subfamily)
MLAFMVDQYTDAEIIVASLSDPERFGEIFERHYPSIYRFLVRRAGREAGSRLASEVFVRAFEGRHRYQTDRVSARPWLYGIAANLARMAARTHQRANRAYLRVAADLPYVGVLLFDRADDRVDAEMLVATLHKTLNRLRPADRETLLLYALGELTYQETADTLGVPVGTVRSRLSRARTRIRELIAEERQTTGWKDDA